MTETWEGAVLEVFAILLGGAYLLVLPFLTLLAWSRSSRHAEQIGKLRAALREAEARNASIDERLNRLQADLLALRPRERDESQVWKPVVPAAAEVLPNAASVRVAVEVPAAVVEPAPSQPEAVEVSSFVAPAAVEYIPERAFTPPPRSAPRPTRARRDPSEPSLPEQAFGAAKAWLFGGNTLVRVGMLLVFLGLAFLLRYASDRVVIPLEARYLGVALTALVALVLGWRLRVARPAYALLMQGGAVAVMYLTVFAALKLHGQPLLSTQAGFALLVAVVALSGVLAVAQNALSLALAGALGGFAAPVLVSTGGGNHVALFSYLALLNAGILGIAWFKAWRPLNLVGFFCTFLIGLAWGMRSYDPLPHYANTQPFLILFFLMFVAIGLLFARRMLRDDPDLPASRDAAPWRAWFARRGHAAERYVDATILFGTPLAGFGLQYALIRHIEYGTAFSALALGLFYLVLARLVHGGDPLRHRLLTEVLLALGMIFASLAIPLGLDAQWTTVAWALEGAGIYWVGHRQHRPLARAFALLLQAGAMAAFLEHVLPGNETLLEGSALGALLLALAFLGNMLALRRHVADEERGAHWDGGFEILFGSLGLWSLYLVAPLQLSAEYTAAAWALAGMLTVFAGLRLKARGWVGNAMLVQLLAGGLFLGQMQADGASGGVLALAGSGWRGLVIASLIGLCALVGLGAAISAARRDDDPARVERLAWGMLFGLGFIALAVLFVLPWQTATAVWAACGFLLMWAALRLNLMPPFWFALALEVAAGLAFLKASGLFLFGPHAWPGAVAAGPFAHAGFWTPIVIALAAFAAAWRLHAHVCSPAADDAAGDADGLQIDGDWLSFPALLWATGWWAFAWWMEWARTDGSGQLAGHHFLAVMAASTLALLPLAMKWSWARLAAVCGLLLPLVALSAAFDYSANRNLLAGSGWAAFGLALVAGFGLLRISGGLLGKDGDKRLHLINCWVWLGVAALETRHLFLALGDPGSAWRWLGWVLPLAAWLLWSARTAPPRLWPAAAHPALYRFSATAPLLAILLAWLGMANIHSSGNAAPLPFIPLLNPLDLALVLILFAGWQWLRQLRAQDPAACAWRQASAPFQLALQAGAFLTYTCVVLRGAHHLAGVPWQMEAMLHSMLVQASLSLAWALLALGLMIAGHRGARREVWIAGAALVVVVLAKLFLIELSNRGGLERIVSFIGVGVLLLVVGYFAPLPPAKEEKR